MATLSALFGNSSETVSWQPQPSTRGTYGILSACISTLLLCTWTAVHLNVSAPEERWSRTLRKTGWLMLGLLAPEMVVFTAWSQYRTAANLLAPMRETLGQPRPPSLWTEIKDGCRDAWRAVASAFRSVPALVSRLWETLSPVPWPMHHTLHGAEGDRIVELYHLRDEAADLIPEVPQAEQVPSDRWTSTHCWYAVMGGFAIDTSRLPPDLVPGSPHRQVLTCSGILTLAKCNPDLIPKLTEDDIKDKSKADGLKKHFVCGQASWFLISTIFRVSQRFPITILELNTFAHAICVLAVYAIWWSKPLDVATTTDIDGQHCQDLVAFFCMASFRDNRREMDLFRYQPSRDVDAKIRFDARPHPNHPRSEGSNFTPSAQDDHDDFDGVLDRLKLPPEDPVSRQAVSQHLLNQFSVLQMGQSLYGFCFEWTSRALNMNGRSSPHLPRRPYILLRRGDISRWQKASEAVRKHDPLRIEEGSHEFVSIDLDCKPGLLVDRVPNHPQNILSLQKFRTRDIPTVVAFTTAGLFYGGLHLLGVNAHFGSYVQQIFWAVSALLLCASGPVLVLYGLSIYSEQLSGNPLPASRPAPPTNSAEKFLRLLPATFRINRPLGLHYAGLMGFLYLAARIYLLVECFLNLVKLDPAVFLIPTWTAYFPHIA